MENLERMCTVAKGAEAFEYVNQLPANQLNQNVTGSLSFVRFLFG